MTILGHNITKLNAERKSLVIKKIDINSTPKITGVKEKDIDVSGLTGDKRTVLGIGFEFLTDYKPNVGKIEIAGEIIYTSEDNKKIVSEWKKNNKLPANVDIEVKNFLLRKCLLIGVNVSQEMQLPAPLVIPVIRPKKDQPNYIG